VLHRNSSIEQVITWNNCP